MTDRWLAILGLLGACVGAAVVTLALFRDRSRGRRRCPTCWYDMSGTPGLTCSECGHATRTERRLFRTRRRWRRAAAGVLMILAGAGSGAGPVIYQHGWLAVVPTTLLLPLVPDVDRTTVYDARTQRNVELAIVKEFRRRTAIKPLAEWQLEYLLTRTGMIRYRRRWPADVTRRIEISAPDWLGCSWMEVQSLFSGKRIQSFDAPHAILDGPSSIVFEGYDDARLAGTILGVAAPGARTLEIQVVVRRDPASPSGRLVMDVKKMEAVLDSRVVLPIEAVGSVDDAVPPVRSAAVDAQVRSSLTLQVHRARPRQGTKDELQLRIEIDRDKLATLERMAVSIRADLLDGQTVTDEAWSHWWQSSRFSTQFAGRHVERGDCFWRKGPVPASREEELRIEPGRYFVRLRGVSDGVLTEWDKTSRWAGEVVYPLEDILQPGVLTERGYGWLFGHDQ